MPDRRLDTGVEVAFADAVDGVFVGVLDGVLGVAFDVVFVVGEAMVQLGVWLSHSLGRLGVPDEQTQHR